RPTPTLVAVGGVHIAIALTRIAQALGYRTIVVDPRPAFGNEARFPHADRVVSEWPDEALGRIGLTRETAVAVLTHDPKLHDPAGEAPPAAARGRAQRDPGGPPARAHRPRPRGAQPGGDRGLGDGAGGGGAQRARRDRAGRGRPGSVIAVLVLAAGGSRRMGRPKMLLPLPGGRTVLATVVSRLLAAPVDRIVVVLGHEAAATRAGAVLPVDPRVTVLDNPDWPLGLSSSLKQGLLACPEADALVVALGDQPAVDP